MLGLLELHHDVCHLLLGQTWILAGVLELLEVLTASTSRHIEIFKKSSRSHGHFEGVEVAFQT